MPNTLEVKIRFVGFCPICEGDFRLRGNKLVHHGFTRPGVGYIIGDCLAVHELPYELSDGVCKQYKAGCQNAVATAENYLAHLKAGEIKTLQVPDHSKGYSRFPDMMEITILHLAFHKAWEAEIYQTESRIRSLTSEIARMQRFIDGWTLKSVRTFEEEMQKKRAETDARKAVREAARQVKRDKAAAIKAKHVRFEAEKEALMAKYREAFLALAAEPFNPNTVGLEAHRVYVTMRKEQGKKGYLNFYPRALEIDEQIWVDLGLATWDNRPGQTPWLRFRY